MKGTRSRWRAKEERQVKMFNDRDSGGWADTKHVR